VIKALCWRNVQSKLHKRKKMMDKKEATNEPTPKGKDLPPPSPPIKNKEKFLQAAPKKIPIQSIPQVQQLETYEPTKIIVMRIYEENNLVEEESESDDEVTSTPLDVFKIYYLATYEIVPYLSTFMYDPIAKHITKETAHKILKEDGTDRMMLDKRIFIHNSAAHQVAMATAGTTVIQEIE